MNIRKIKKQANKETNENIKKKKKKEQCRFSLSHKDATKYENRAYRKLRI